eukprot:gene9064-biopygen13727
MPSAPRAMVPKASQNEERSHPASPERVLTDYQYRTMNNVSSPPTWHRPAPRYAVAHPKGRKLEQDAGRRMLAVSFPPGSDDGGWVRERCAQLPQLPHARARARARACVRACVRVCMRVRACACVGV